MPVRVAPISGEAIDSWLEATARAVGLTAWETLKILGIPRSRWFGLVVRPTAGELESLTRATGISHNRLLSMTLSSYNGTAVEIDNSTGLVGPRFPFTLRGGSRFCPLCLAETRGRWQLRWRLGWSFVCTAHECLLVDRCADCGRRARARYMPNAGAPSRCICGVDLRAVPAQSVTQSPALASAQQVVLDVIASDRASFGIYANAEDPPEARSVLTDIAALANGVLTCASVHGFVSVKPAGLVAFGGESTLEARQAPPRRGTSTTTAPSRAVETAIGVAAAIAILEAPNVNGGAERARWLFDQTSGRRYAAPSMRAVLAGTQGHLPAKSPDCPYCDPARFALGNGASLLAPS